MPLGFRGREQRFGLPVRSRCRHGIPGKNYTVLQGINAKWKWSVPALVGQTKSGHAGSCAASVKAAQRAIDKALAPRKKRLMPRDG